jgi:hypothetical protein
MLIYCIALIAEYAQDAMSAEFKKLCGRTHYALVRHINYLKVTICITQAPEGLMGAVAV